jgi:DNA-binding transcriptional LysR family regulator
MLRIAQPAVSRQILRLEDELGVPLFHRTPRGMNLSAAGEMFLRRARIVLEEVRQAKVEARAGTAVEEGAQGTPAVITRETTR